MRAKNFHNYSDEGVSLILGIDTCHIVRPKVVTFGHRNNLSSYIESPFGILPIGSISKMLKNTSFLPKAMNDFALPHQSEICNSESFLSSTNVNFEAEMFCLSVDNSNSRIIIIQ